MNRDMIIADAEVAASFLRTLIANHLKGPSASSLTTAYIRAQVTASRATGLKLTAEQVLEHAETTAVYLSSLTDKGVGRVDAISFAAEYAQNLVWSEASKIRPREPWEDQEGGQR